MGNIDKIKSCEDIYKNKNNELDRNVGRSLVGFYGQYLLTKYGEDEKVNKYINALCNDIVNNISKFKKEPEDDKKDAIIKYIEYYNNEKINTKRKGLSSLACRLQTFSRFSFNLICLTFW